MPRNYSSFIQATPAASPQACSGWYTRPKWTATWFR